MNGFIDAYADMIARRIIIGFVCCVGIVVLFIFLQQYIGQHQEEDEYKKHYTITVLGVDGKFVSTYHVAKIIYQEGDEIKFQERHTGRWITVHGNWILQQDRHDEKEAIR